MTTPDARAADSGMTLLEVAVIAVIVAILIVIVVGSHKNHEKFKQVCDDTRGTTVWDGRQYQCIKSATPPSTP